MSRDPELNQALCDAWDDLLKGPVRSHEDYLQAALAHPGPRIAHRVADLLPDSLAPAVLERERLGFFKYGQFLDLNRKPERAKAVHAVQELLDFCAYAIWLGHPWLAWLAAFPARWLCRRYRLTAQDIVEGGKS